MCGNEILGYQPAPDLMQRAYVAADGTMAWKRPDALRVIREATAAGCAVVAVEVWHALDQPQWRDTHTHIIFTTPTEARTYRWAIDHEWDAQAECWGDYAAAAAASAATWMGAVTPEADSMPEYARNISFHVAWMAREAAE